MRACLLKEVIFRTSRSSGPGGQHVNKTETRVELHWNLQQSNCLNEDEKSLLRSRLRSRLTREDELILVDEGTRSQRRNRENVTQRFLDLIRQGLKPVKKRIRTRPTRKSRERRLEEKRKRGELKRNRRWND